MNLMIIDALNIFYRAYIVNPAINPDGQPVGGVYGFLKMLQKYCRDIEPDKIIVVWDGVGGSRRRKAINKDYKAGRKPPTLNRFANILDDEQQSENKLWQHARLIEYLSTMPVTQLVVDNVEADDIISYITQHEDYGHWQKIIVSNDKDFFQLCSSEVSIYRKDKSSIMTDVRVLSEYNIAPHNFVLARALSGDNSDNLKGVPRCGLKTVATRFPFLAGDKTYTITDILDHCQNQKLKVYKNILENEAIFRQNYKLMNLSSPAMSYHATQEVNNDLMRPLIFNKMALDGYMLKDAINYLQFSEMNRFLLKIFKQWKIQQQRKDP